MKYNKKIKLYEGLRNFNKIHIEIRVASVSIKLKI